MCVIDFTNSIEKVCEYGGSEKKKKIIYNGEVYLLKFPDPIREKNMPLSYINNVFSEYIGCKIFDSVNIPVQKVILGIYNEKKENEIKQKVVVACKDFTSEKQKLVEFSSLANSITGVDKKFITKIEDIYEVFNNLNYDFDKKIMIENFWNMFIVDTLIGNTDRHLSNFGVIDDGKTLKFSPVNDCGSALHPLLTDEKINYLLNNESEFKNVAYSIYPVYTYENKKITYSEFYKKDISDLNDALLRIYPRIEMNKIYDIIDNTMYLSLERKEFLKKSVTIRKEKILDVAYKKLNK